MSLGLVGSMFCRRGLQAALGHQLRIGSPKWLTTSAIARTTAFKEGEDFFDKNKRLNRPTSPHLTIYKIQITSLLSVTHRATGLALSAYTSAFAIAMLALPGSFPHYLNALNSCQFGGGMIFLTKFALAFPFMFHLSNGIRHLAWDLGKGFQLKSVYATGYAVLGIATILTLIVASM